VQILPSGHDSAAPGQARLALAPFRGLRYAPQRVSGLAEVLSPPYDVIARDIADQLLAADPHNVVRLILPRHAPTQQGDAYHDAARTLREWQDAQILTPDPEPSLYVYEQATDGAQVIQRGLIGALRLIQPDARVIRPHEDVAPGPVAGRLQLMEATQANLEPIFLLYDRGEGADGAASGAAAESLRGGRDGAASRSVAEAASGLPLAEAVTSDGIRHRLWAVTDPGRLDAIAADLATRSALIADGHHRYAAYLRLQARRRAAGAGPGPWDYGLALLVDASAYPPDIGAIHRVIPGLPPAAATRRAADGFEVSRLPGGTRRLAAALDDLADASTRGPAFLVAGGSEVSLLTEPDQGQLGAAMPPGHSPRWRSLAASVLQELLLRRIWKVGDSEADVRVVQGDAAAAVREADEAAGTAVLCSPMPAADVYALAAAGERVPRKSTSFGPKPRTGLVIRTFAQG
jgi:uncharacterized protein (DUF1015 family)